MTAAPTATATPPPEDASTLVVISLRSVVLYPGMIITLPVGRPTSVAAIHEHLETGAPLLLVPQIDPDEENPLRARLPGTGTTARVLRVAELPDGTVRALVEGLTRVRLAGPVVRRGPACAAPVVAHPDPAEDPIAVAAAARALATLFQEWLGHGGFSGPDQELLVDPGSDPERLADQVSANVPLSLAARITVLDEASVAKRLGLLSTDLEIIVAGQRIAKEVGERVQKAMDKSQREYHLKEQLKAIQEELSTLQGSPGDADTFEERIIEAGLPEEALEDALREVDRLRRLQPDSAEYTISRTWLETICDVPWSTFTSDRTDLTRASRVLNKDHHGLEKVKERILEYLAVRQLNPDAKGAILCFVGPPGVGKTSLGRSIARALGRKFGRIALGGIKDETEIRGHRRTYIGALPGRILRALIRAGSANPVLVLDEIDKVGNDFRGDPASALLEVLDPEQNVAFADHYLDVTVDLSHVLFIATANVMDTVPAALQDRLEIIDISGYIEEEKVVIARKHLLPRIVKRHGLKGVAPTLTAGALEHTIRDYTHEAGVRELERQLATLHRKVARQVVEGNTARQRITEKKLIDFLGPAKHISELAERFDQPGVVTGLAWTAGGGEILFVESARMVGKPGLKLTGSLGDVMKESAEAALSWLRSHASRLGIDQSTFQDELHLHVPAGAIPKDGPSAGVTMVTALASITTGRAVRASLAMTGEITLRGKVLPVGGVKEKVLAARRAGVKTVLLPRQNGTDLADIPPELQADLTFVLIDTIDDVLAHALLPERPATA